MKLQMAGICLQARYLFAFDFGPEWVSEYVNPVTTPGVAPKFRAPSGQR